MKTYLTATRKLCHFSAFALVLLLSASAYAADEGLAPGHTASGGAFSEATGDLRAAESQLEKAAGEFGANSAQKSEKVPFSDAAAKRQPGSNSRLHNVPSADPRADAMQGSPATGYAGTWTDPATGDIMTSVIAPAPQQNHSQSYPIIVEPQVSPDWGNGNWNNGWQGSNWGNGWQGSAPMWPTPPGDPGYMPPPSPPHSPPAMNRPGFVPGYYPPPPLPDNFHPGYRPLRPHRPGNAFIPGQGGWNPGMGNRPPHQRPPANGSIWNPGNNMWGGNHPPMPPNFQQPGWGGNRPPMPPNFQQPGGGGMRPPQPRGGF